MKLLVLALALSACAYGNGTISFDEPEAAEESTYYLLTPDLAQCTAWGVDDNHVVTAGHCCQEEGVYTLISSKHRHIDGTVAKVIFDDGDEDPVATPKDACLIETSTPVSYLPLADVMPDKGDYVQYIGYPKGKWIHSEGFYMGDVDGSGNYNNYLFTAPCDHGASGSAVLNAGGQAWGILVRLYFNGVDVYPGSFGCVASPLSQILEVLDARD